MPAEPTEVADLSHVAETSWAFPD